MVTKSVTTACLLLLLIGLAITPESARADDVAEAIKEATEAYNAKDYQGAVESLDYAKQLIQQKTSEGLAKFLPEPLDGWEASEAQSQNLGILGGSAGVEKNYVKSGGDGGRQQVTVSIMGDSPMFRGMMAMFTPAIAGADGGKLQKIQRNKAVVKYSEDNRDGEIFIDVDKKYLVTVKGSNVEKEALMAYAEALNYDGLKDF